MMIAAVAALAILVIVFLVANLLTGEKKVGQRWMRRSSTS